MSSTPLSKEQIIDKHKSVERRQSTRPGRGMFGSYDFEYLNKNGAKAAMQEYADPYIKISELISNIFYYGGFKAETANERKLEKLLTEVGLWPTTEDEILKRNP